MLPTMASSSQTRNDVSRYAVSDDASRRQPFAGMKGNPVHVVVDEGNISVDIFIIYDFQGHLRPYSSGLDLFYRSV